MKFKDFLEHHKKIWPSVSFFPGSTGLIDVMRVWNSLEILFPDKCDDVIIWRHKDENPYTVPSNISMDDALNLYPGDNPQMDIIRKTPTLEDVEKAKIAIESRKAQSEKKDNQATSKVTKKDKTKASKS